MAESSYSCRQQSHRITAFRWPRQKLLAGNPVAQILFPCYFLCCNIYIYIYFQKQSIFWMLRKTEGTECFVAPWFILCLTFLPGPFAKPWSRARSLQEPLVLVLTLENLEALNCELIFLQTEHRREGGADKGQMHWFVINPDKAVFWGSRVDFPPSFLTLCCSDNCSDVPDPPFFGAKDKSPLYKCDHVPHILKALGSSPVLICVPWVWCRPAAGARWQNIWCKRVEMSNLNIYMCCKVVGQL